MVCYHITSICVSHTLLLLLSFAGGFQLFRDSAPFRTAAPTDTINNFVPPVLNASSQTNTVKGTTLVLTFYGIPTAPGKSRVITAFFTNAKVPAFAAKLASAVEWVFHLVRGTHQPASCALMLLLLLLLVPASIVQWSGCSTL
jgi:hypothetical protein